MTDTALPRSAVDRFLSVVERAGNLLPHPATLFFLLTVVVVGGGPTGVELAGAFAELANHVLRDDFRHIDPTEARVVLIEAAPRLLLQFPEELGENYSGKTNIGCWIEGIKDGKFKRYYIYNVCDHAACWKEVRSQAISYTTGVPASLGAKLLLGGVWKKPGVHNVEEMDPTPFMEQIGALGLPWVETYPDKPLPI